MKKTTKILSLLMALVMIFSLTTVALADDAEVTLGTTQQKRRYASGGYAYFLFEWPCPLL